MTKLRWLVRGCVVAFAAAAYMDFVFAPEDALQGPVQRIFYLHVSSAIAAYACFALVLIGGILYLWREDPRADRLARAAAPVGLLFTTVTFVMGMIWAKPIWNWDPSKTWDARLSSTAVLWAVYAGYVLVRRFAPPGRTAARLAAVVGIVGFVDVPVVHFSVLWWRTLHPQPVIETGALPGSMLLAWLATLLAVLLLTGTLVATRYLTERNRELIESRRDRQELVRLESAAEAP
ncbi:MAG TPA: cytochrome c biogenesis protein [Candidatus Dormibacteraeota bacterium]